MSPKDNGKVSMDIIQVVHDRLKVIHNMINISLDMVMFLRTSLHGHAKSIYGWECIPGHDEVYRYMIKLLKDVETIRMSRETMLSGYLP
jgi:hypothetical protein